jgi:hypothetical protein
MRTKSKKAQIKTKKDIDKKKIKIMNVNKRPKR